MVGLVWWRGDCRAVVCAAQHLPPPPPPPLLLHRPGPLLVACSRSGGGCLLPAVSPPVPCPPGGQARPGLVQGGESPKHATRDMPSGGGLSWHVGTRSKFASGGFKVRFQSETA